MDLPSASINSLPPELLASIVHWAAECDSSSESYKDRLKNLRALSLVNRSFRFHAQPLFARVVYIEAMPEDRHFLDTHLSPQVRSLVCLFTRAWRGDWDVHFGTLRPPDDFPFKFLRELCCLSAYLDGLSALSGHEHLMRLSIDHCTLAVGDSDTVVPYLKELSLNEVYARAESPESDHTPWLSSLAFPSLRALGLSRLYLFSSTKQVSGLKSLITQLDCFSTDDIQTHCPSPQPKTPLLYDHTLSRGTTLEHEKHILESPASNQRYIRVGLRDEWIESAQVDLDVALDFVFFLLDKCTKLEQLYLDRAISGYQYDDTPTEEVKVRVERVEVVAEEKGVEIIWENEKDDLVRSLVSEEFWKRARQLKGDE